MLHIVTIAVILGNNATRYLREAEYYVNSLREEDLGQAEEALARQVKEYLRKQD